MSFKQSIKLKGDGFPSMQEKVRQNWQDNPKKRKAEGPGDGRSSTCCWSSVQGEISFDIIQENALCWSVGSVCLAHGLGGRTSEFCAEEHP